MIPIVACILTAILAAYLGVGWHRERQDWLRLGKINANHVNRISELNDELNTLSMELHTLRMGRINDRTAVDVSKYKIAKWATKILDEIEYPLTRKKDK